jgi:hypothetical protein
MPYAERRSRCREDAVRSAKPMGFTFQKQRSVLPSRYHYQATLFVKGESFSLGQAQGGSFSA